MPRVADAPSRIEILVMSSLARAPMHGYELKLELRYKHVRWWAKLEHGHLYAALARLESRGYIRQVKRAGARHSQRVFALTPSGRRRLEAGLEALGPSEDSTYFDVDLFVASAFVLERKRALELLGRRRAAIAEQLRSAQELRRAMSPFVPAAGRLIMDHRVDHLARELAFAEQAGQALAAEPTWGPFLGKRPISDFVNAHEVPLERAKVSH